MFKVYFLLVFSTSCHFFIFWFLLIGQMVFPPLSLVHQQIDFPAYPPIHLPRLILLICFLISTLISYLIMSFLQKWCAYHSFSHLWPFAFLHWVFCVDFFMLYILCWRPNWNVLLYITKFLACHECQLNKEGFCAKSV